MTGKELQPIPMYLLQYGERQYSNTLFTKSRVGPCHNKCLISEIQPIADFFGSTVKIESVHNVSDSLVVISVSIRDLCDAHITKFDTKPQHYKNGRC